MKNKKEFSTIDEVRYDIDSIDKQIISLLGERLQCVKEIVRFKSNVDDVVAKNRYNEVIRIRKEWATEEGLNAEIIEKIYVELMQYFIGEQMKMLNITNN